jgi:hypothetical protein
MSTVVIDILARDRASNTLDRVGNSAKSSSSKLVGFAKVGGAAVAAGALIAGAAAVKFSADAIGAASDLNETLSKSQQIFGQNAKAMEKWAGNADRSLGLSKNSALASAASFGDMFSQIGFSGDASAKMSKSVLQMSADLGSFNNLETSDVADRMSAAFRGEYDSLQAVIPNINAARVESQALATTGKKTAKELTAQEKAAAVLAIVHKDGAKASGDFARTSDGLANQQKILGAQFDNVKAKLGQGLLPIATKVVTWMNDKMIPGAKKLGDYLGEKLGPVFAKVGGFISDKLVPALERVGDFIMNRVIPPIKELAGKWLGAVKQGFENAKAGASNAMPFLDLLAGAFKGVWAIVEHVLLPVLGKLYEIVFPLLGVAIGLIATALGGIGIAGKWMWNNILQPVFKGMVIAIGKVLHWLSELFGAMASIPGAPKWIKKTSDALDTAAQKANDVADGIKKIDGTTANVKVNMIVTGRESIRAAEEEIRRLKIAANNNRYGGSNLTGGDPGSRVYRDVGQ